MSPSVKKPGRLSAASTVDERSWISGEDCPNERARKRLPDAWRDAVRLWLQWNTAYERVVQGLYQHGHDPCRLEDLMDQMDQVRRRAVRLSRELLS
jgi:hypothetical protein